MGHFALVDENGIVQQVVKGEQENIDEMGPREDTSQWIQTSYNTHGGIYCNPQSDNPSNGTPLRYNYAMIGGHYDFEADAFYPAQPYPNWVLNTTNYTWEPPVPQPAAPPGAPNYWVWAVIRNEWVYDEPPAPIE
jgi:hypothetical protein